MKFFSFVQFRMSRKPLNDSITLCYHSPCASSGEFLKVGMLSPMVSMYMRSFSWAVHKVAHLYTDLSRNILSAEIFFFILWMRNISLQFKFSFLLLYKQAWTSFHVVASNLQFIFLRIFCLFRLCFCKAFGFVLFSSWKLSLC